MKRNRIFLATFALIVVAFCLFGSSNAITATTTTVADRDTYVDIDNPLSNYGAQTYLYTGLDSMGYIYAAYLHFSLASRPEGVTGAKLRLDIWSVSETVNLSIWRVNDSWTELGVTYDNQPVGIERGTFFLVGQSQTVEIDVLAALEGRTEISFCINASEEVYTDYVAIDSREYSLTTDRPAIVWTYEQEAYIDGYPPAFVTFVLLAATALVVRKYRKHISPI